MTFFDTGFEGLLLWESSSSYYPDSRGSFQELFNQQDFPRPFATYQVNHSYSVPGVVRGLHYQLPPRAQAKIAHVLKGSAYAVALDLRAKSAAFGRHFAVEITGENRKHLFIPKGFAYGFAVGPQGAVVLYQVDAPYHHPSARVIKYNDKQLAINWPEPRAAAIVSDADAAGMSWADYLKHPVF